MDSPSSPAPVPTALASAPPHPPIVDCFLYNGDAEVVQQRLQLMAPHVDLIILTEAKMTHSGVPKPEMYSQTRDKRLFVPYKDKIMFLYIQEFPKMTPKDVEDMKRRHPWMEELDADPKRQEIWFRENFQRDCCRQLLKQVEATVAKRKLGASDDAPKKFILEAKIDDDDKKDDPSPPPAKSPLAHFEDLLYAADGRMIIISADCDEIVHPRLLQDNLAGMYSAIDASPHRCMYLWMEMYYYNWHWKKHNDWKAAVVTTSTDVHFDALRAQRHSADPVQLIPHAGWHLSYYMTFPELVRKIESYTHQEHNDPKYKSFAHLSRCVCEGIDLFERTDVQSMSSRAHYLMPVQLVPRDDVDRPVDFGYSGYNENAPYRSWCSQVVALANAVAEGVNTRNCPVIMVDCLSVQRRGGGSSHDDSSSSCPYDKFSNLVHPKFTSHALRNMNRKYDGLCLLDRSENLGGGDDGATTRLQLVDAWYGAEGFQFVNVREKVKSWFGTAVHPPRDLKFNALFGVDPCYNVVKKLQMYFEVQEGRFLDTPKIWKPIGGGYPPCQVRIDWDENDASLDRLHTHQEILNQCFESSVFYRAPYEPTDPSILGDVVQALDVFPVLGDFADEPLVDCTKQYVIVAPDVPLETAMSAAVQMSMAAAAVGNSSVTAELWFFGLEENALSCRNDWSSCVLGISKDHFMKLQPPMMREIFELEMVKQMPKIGVVAYRQSNVGAVLAATLGDVRGDNVPVHWIDDPDYVDSDHPDLGDGESQAQVDVVTCWTPEIKKLVGSLIRNLQKPRVRKIVVVVPESLLTPEDIGKSIEGVPIETFRESRFSFTRQDVDGMLTHKWWLDWLMAQLTQLHCFDEIPGLLDQVVWLDPQCQVDGKLQLYDVKSKVIRLPQLLTFDLAHLNATQRQHATQMNVPWFDQEDSGDDDGDAKITSADDHISNRLPYDVNDERPPSRYCPVQWMRREAMDALVHELKTLNPGCLDLAWAYLYLPITEDPMGLPAIPTSSLYGAFIAQMDEWRSTVVEYPVDCKVEFDDHGAYRILLGEGLKTTDEKKKF